jgi:hypothetical protein
VTGRRPTTAGFTIADAMALSRHADPKTLMIYNDRRREVAGEIADYLAGE